MATLEAFKIFQAACEAAIPRGGVTISEWADTNRVLSPEASAEPGRWRTARIPYSREWQDAVNDPRVWKIVLMTSSQVGKSEVLNNTCGYYMHYDPCPIMLIQPTLDRMKDYSKKRIEPMIRDTPALAAITARESTRSADYTTLSKAFIGGHLLMTGANAASALASNPIRVILADEIDRYPRDVDNEGDPLSLAIVRTRTFTNKKIVVTSTPTNKGQSRIEDEFEESDKRRYFVPCPHCGEYQILEWERLVYETDENENVIRAIYACENGCEILEHHKLQMLDEGEWRAEREHNGVVGFHINALYSVWYSWREMARDFIKAKKEAKEGKPEKLKVFINTGLGETWNLAHERSDIQGLENRAEEYLAEVPTGVLCLTAGVDTQPNRLECEVIGWGEGFESWSLNFFVLYGDTDKQDVWLQLKEILLKEWECEREDANGNRLTRTIDAVCIDSGGHNTQAVYDFVKAHASYNWLAVKGLSGVEKEIISKRPTILKGGVKLFNLGTKLLKDRVFNRLAITEIGTGYCHFPVGYDGEFYKQLTAEKRVKKIKKFLKDDPYGYAQYQYKKIRDRNEALDCRVYGTAAVEYLNPNFPNLLSEENRLCERKPVPVHEDYQLQGKQSFVRPGAGNRGGFVSSWGRK